MKDITACFAGVGVNPLSYLRGVLVRGALLAIVGGVALSSSGANFPLGTYVYTGSVLDWRHEAQGAAEGVTIQAVTTNGTVLSSSRVTDPSVSRGANYRLEVPVSTESSAKSAAVGDTLNCVIISDEGATNVTLNPLPPIVAANAITNVNFVNASATSFPAPAEGRSAALVADDYLAGLASWMKAYGKAEYDPWSDWDGDGISNYDEYKAGTNPFDASDRLRITKFNPGEPATLLKFEYAGGHLYAIDCKRSLTNLTWSAASFSVDSPEATAQRTFSMPGNEYENIGEATIYVAPASSEPSMFYTVRPE